MLFLTSTLKSLPWCVQDPAGRVSQRAGTVYQITTTGANRMSNKSLSIITGMAARDHYEWRIAQCKGEGGMAIIIARGNVGTYRGWMDV